MVFDKKQFNWILYFAFFLAFASYFFGFFVDVTRDCGKYATVAKEIYINGNFINLTIHGEPYDQKPPLLFWLGAIGFFIGGVSNFWFKFPVFLVVLLGIYSTYRMGKSMYNKSTGHIAAIMLFFSFIYTLYTLDIHTDTPVQAFAAFALWQLYDFIKTRKNINWILGFIGIGLAMLSKGPMGAVVPAFAVIGHILLKKDFKLLLNFRWYLGIVLSFIVVSPALIGLFNQFGLEGIRFFFWENNIGRITGSYNTTYYDPTLYIHSTLYLFIPWSFMLFIAVFYDIKTRIKNKFVAHEHFTFAGIWIFFVILSFSKSMLPNYIFILIPLMAILTARWIDETLRLKTNLINTLKNTQLAMTILLWIVVLTLAFYLFPFNNLIYWLVGLILIGITFYTYFIGENRKAKLILPPAIAYTALSLLLTLHVLPYMFSFQAPPKAARLYNKEAESGETLYNYGYSQYELFFYSEPQAEQINDFTELKSVVQQSKSWIFTNPAGLDSINMLHPPIDTIYNFKHLYLNSAGRFIPPGSREDLLKPMYLVKLK